MAMKTFTLKIGNRTIQAQGGEAAVNKLVRTIRNIDHIAEHKRELKIHDGREYVMNCFSFSLRGDPGKFTPLDPAQWRADVDEFIARLPELIKSKQLPALQAEAESIFDKHVLVVDLRAEA